MNASRAPAGNPFSTRRVRPGAITYLFPPDEDAASLVARLSQQAWRGQIVGPHGSGKSTLLQSLLEEIHLAGRQPILVTLRDGERRLPRGSVTPAQLDAGKLLTVDGYEQLSRWSRWRLARACRRCGCGLLATSHYSVGFPDLMRVCSSLQVAQRVVAQLLRSAPCRITQTDVAEAFDRCRGNVRETLFDLYDLYERQRMCEVGGP